MPVLLSALLNREETGTFVIEWMGERVTFVYRPALVNPARIDEVQEAQAVNPDMSQGETWLLLLSPLVSWDIEDEGGNPVPVSAEILEQLPTPFLEAILAGMRSAVRPTQTRVRSKRGSFGR